MPDELVLLHDRKASGHRAVVDPELVLHLPRPQALFELRGPGDHPAPISICASAHSSLHIVRRFFGPSPNAPDEMGGVAFRTLRRRKTTTTAS